MSSKSDRSGSHDPATWPSVEELLQAGKGGRAAVTLPSFEVDGRTFEPTHSAVRSEKGEALGQVMVARDITERRDMERHLMHEERMSVVGKLAAIVAHEINNPIGVVSLYSQHALARLDDDDPVRAHEVIDGGAFFLADLSVNALSQIIIVTEITSVRAFRELAVQNQ